DISDKMESVTLLIAVVAGISMFFVRPVFSLIVFITTLIWYPYYLTVKVGPANFSVSRILIVVIFIKILLTPDILNKFKFELIDKFAIAFAVLCLAAGLITTESGSMLVYWGGSLFDTVLPYFAVRIMLKSSDDYLKLLKWVMIVSIPLAIVAVYQSITSDNPFGFLERFNAFSEGKEYIPLSRSGFYRANLTFGVSIMLGIYFAIVLGCCAGLSKCIKEDKSILYAGLLILGLGVAASMSSGPLTALIVLVAVLPLYKYRQYWKLFVGLLMAGILLLQIVSNTSWYEALSRLTFSEDTAYYRVLLIRKAFGGGMSGHWLTGYGLVDPGWGDYLFGRNHTDACNHYIEILIVYGLLGLIPFIGLLVGAFMKLREAFVLAKADSERWIVWTIMSTLIALLVTFMSVSLFAQTRTVFYIMLAFCANAPFIITQKVFPVYKSRVAAGAVIVHTETGLVPPRI
ncbi:MAG: hypothetical protein WAK60_08640, partial [Sedimentisphaerales bacterium]